MIVRARISLEPSTTWIRRARTVAQVVANVLGDREINKSPAGELERRNDHSLTPIPVPKTLNQSIFDDSFCSSVHDREHGTLPVLKGDLFSFGGE